MREKQVEAKLVQAAKTRGGLCLKFVSPGLDGVPDRMVLLSKGKIGFVEVKAKSKKPRPLQRKRLKQLSNLGFHCFVLDNINDIKQILDTIGGDAL